MIKYHEWKKKGGYHSKHIFYHSGVLVMPILSCTVKTSSMMVVFLLKKPTTWVHGYSWSVQIVFQGLKIVTELVQVIIKTPWILVLHHCDVGDNMMGCLKNRLFELCLRRGWILYRNAFFGFSDVLRRVPGHSEIVGTCGMRRTATKWLNFIKIMYFQ